MTNKSGLTDFFADDIVEDKIKNKESILDNNKTKSYSLSQLAQNEWKDYAMYTIESRAIPNMIDGMKPVMRFYTYSSILNSSQEFKKVSAVSGVLSGYGYQHGESSAAAAGQLMAAEWSNNICLIQGRGSFGTRLVNDAAAPRYTYTKLHKNFGKFITDLDLAPEHSDPEHEPPAFYIPVIPLVLVNGIKGIGTGFATNILPRCPIDLTNACEEYLKTGSIKKRIKLKFPDFTGSVTYDKVNTRYLCRGIFERKSKTVILITEVPPGFDREGYIKVLDVLEEKGLIVSYDDLCDKNGFRFEVKLKLNGSSLWDDEKIILNFKLEKPFSENLTVIDQNGKLREYTDERDLVRDFCLYRNTILQKRIDLRIQEFTELGRWLTVKMQFISVVLDEKIAFKGNKKDNVVAQIMSNTEATLADCDRLLRLNIMTLTDEMVQILKNEIKDAKLNLKFWESTTVKEQFIEDLEKLREKK